MRRSGSSVIGTLRVTRGGTAFLVPEDGGPEVRIVRTAGVGALAGDRVEAHVKETRWGRRGRVIDVIEPRTRGALGVIERSGRGYRVALDRRDLPPWLNVSRVGLRGASVGERVWVELLRDGSGACSPNCVVREVLGAADDARTDFRAVALQFGLTEDFSAGALAEGAGAGLRRGEISGRRDLRRELVFTIDPEDAADHDDALSFRELVGGRFEIGVHIADVCSFVRGGGPLDLAAKERGSSVYLCDGVLPMLPPRLSADLCSLVPGRDRLTLSVLFIMDGSANVERRELVRGVVRSKARLSYEEAQARLEGAGRPGRLCFALRGLVRLAGQLAERRAARGALDLEIPEPRVVLGDCGIPTELSRERRLESHRIVEEFMLLANESVAEEASKRKMPFIYRVHPAPKEEKLEELSDKLGELGVRFKASSVRRGADMGAQLGTISDPRRRSLGAYLVLRAMERARYASHPGLHFGLASDRYCHFTSPIRRYPDLYNHRALRRSIFGVDPESKMWDPEEVSESAAAAEERADEAERESIAIKCIRFMAERVGRYFTGIVTAVTAGGCFVELDEYPVEGFARRQAERRSRRGRAGLYLGDRVRVRVLRADPQQKELDLAVVKKAPLDTD